MNAFINPPDKIPFLLKIGIWISKKATGKDLLPARLLSWFPKAAIGSAVMESLIAKEDKDIDGRILKLVRIQVSFTASCSFCIDMNSFKYDIHGISDDEIFALKTGQDINNITTFSKKERLALQYATLISSTPLRFDPEFISELKLNFSEREIVILATTAAQVNYWARLIQGLGVPPAGFSD
ncbi:MAG: carboxymuconolactone decarboxylase family protein [Eubacteriales bacterium]